MVKELWVPERSDIIWIDFNPQKGREIRDMHPMLVMSPRKFNHQTGLVIGLPMTTAEYNDTNPFAVKFQDKAGVTSYILAHQPKSFDWRLCNAKLHPWKNAPKEIFATACELLNQIILLVE